MNTTKAAAIALALAISLVVSPALARGPADFDPSKEAMKVVRFSSSLTGLLYLIIFWDDNANQKYDPGEPTRSVRCLNCN